MLLNIFLMWSKFQDKTRHHLIELLVLLTVIIFYSVFEYYSANCNKRISITVGFQKQAHKQSLESANQNLNKGIACSANWSALQTFVPLLGARTNLKSENKRERKWQLMIATKGTELILKWWNSWTWSHGQISLLSWWLCPNFRLGKKKIMSEFTKDY